MALSGTLPFKTRIYTGPIPDIGTSSTSYVTVAARCKVITAYVVNHAAEGGTGANALTASVTGTTITGMTGTMAQSAAAGTVTQMTPTAVTTAVAGDTLAIITDGGGSASCPATVTWVVQEF